jgi:hypothetical protein
MKEIILQLGWVPLADQVVVAALLGAIHRPKGAAKR